MAIAKRYLSRQLVEEAFQNKSLIVEIWGDTWGADNGIGRIKKIMMHRPGDEVLLLQGDAAQIESGSVLSWEIKGREQKMIQKSKPPRLEKLQAQHDTLASVLRQEGVEIVPLEDDGSGLWPERCFARDLGMVIPGGVISSRFALYMRYGESRLASQTWSRIGMPVLGTIHGAGLSEGGSFIMLDPTTAIIGRSERVNQQGIHQL